MPTIDDTRPPSEASRSSTGLRLASLVPFAVAFAIVIAAPRYFDPMFGKPPEIMGVALGVIVGGLTLAWAALGAWIIWTTRSPAVATLAMVVFTFPALFGIILGPAVILIMQNLP